MSIILPNITGASAEVDLTSLVTAYNYSGAFLPSGSVWTLTHQEDLAISRVVQVYKENVLSDVSLDFDEGDEGSFTQENSAKTIFSGGSVFLEGTPGRLGHWHLNEVSGLVVVDVLGLHNGTAVNIVDGDWVAGKLNNCISVTGTKYIQMGNNFSLERTDPFTIEAWIKTSDANNYRVYVGKITQTGTITGYSLCTKFGKPVVEIRGSGGNAIEVSTSSVTIHNGVWRHVLVTYDGSSTAAGVNIYVDNIAVAMTVVTNTLASSIINASNFQISGRTGTNYVPAALIDEVIIWNRVLSISEISARYNAGVGSETVQGYDITQAWYVTTNTNQIDTSSWSTIRSMSFTQVTPVSTDIRYLISCDNKVTWKYWDGLTWTITTLANIATLGNTKTELEALTEANWESCTNTLDVTIGLKTIIDNATPTVSQIEIEYCLPGLQRALDSELEILLVSETLTAFTNVSGTDLYSLRAKFIF